MKSQCLCHLLPPYIFFSFFTDLCLAFMYSIFFIPPSSSSVDSPQSPSCTFFFFFIFFFSHLTSESDSLHLFLENKLGNYTFCCEHVLLHKIAFCFIQLLMFALCLHYLKLLRHFLVLRIFIESFYQQMPFAKERQFDWIIHRK